MFWTAWKKLTLIALVAGFRLTNPGFARNKRITLPPRDRVELQLDHGRVTLVEEERRVPLTQGINEVVFVWANTSLDRRG